MSVTELSSIDRHGAGTTADVDVVIPVYNEAAQLVTSVTRLRTYLDARFPFTSTITIADNASSDGTWQIATDLAGARAGVNAIRLDEKGRGRALRAAWSKSSATVVAYMDVDLATDLDALLPLIAPLLSGHSDLAIGTRLAPGAHVVRGARREFISRGYNLLLRSALRTSCTDAQCGFKAVRRETARSLLPLVEDEEWFFDTELLVTAQRLGLRIHEVPVHWIDDTDSRVELFRTALTDLRGMWRLFGPAARQRITSGTGPARTVDDRPEAGPNSTPRRVEYSTPRLGSGLAPRAGRGVARDGEVFAEELLRFAGVGALSTLAYVGLFAALRSDLGGYAANAVAIGICSLGNTALHREMVGAAAKRLGRRYQWAGATALLAVSLGFTTAALFVARLVGLDSLVPELFALTAANLAAAFVRFGILRTWVFRPAFGSNLTPLLDRPDPRRDELPPPRTGTETETMKETAS